MKNVSNAMWAVQIDRTTRAGPNRARGPEKHSRPLASHAWPYATLGASSHVQRTPEAFPERGRASSLSRPASARWPARYEHPATSARHVAQTATASNPHGPGRWQAARRSNSEPGSRPAGLGPASGHPSWSCCGWNPDISTCMHIMELPPGRRGG